MNKMELGVHDLVTLNINETPEEAYERTKHFVKEIEAMNFKRYWFAEHHGSKGHASSSPELMAAYMSAIEYGDGFRPLVRNFRPVNAE